MAETHFPWEETMGPPYEVPENPNYDAWSIKRPTAGTPAFAEMFNQIFQQLVTNIHAVKAIADSKAATDTATAERDGLLSKADKAALDEAVKNIEDLGQIFGSAVAGGDLQGTYPNPTINPAKLAGIAQTFAQAASRGNVASGDTLEVALGKLAKWYSDLKAVAWSGSYADLGGRPGSFPPEAHSHDDRYYTEGEMESRLAGKSDTSHGHTAAQVGAAAAGHTHTAAQVGAAASYHTHTPDQVGAAFASHTHNNYLESVNSGIKFGAGTTSSATNSFVGGRGCSVSGSESFAFGSNSSAGTYGTSIGNGCRADMAGSFAMGQGTTASYVQLALGQYNKSVAAPDFTDKLNGTILIIGNGDTFTRRNCFRVEKAGRVYSTGSYSTSGADYAEFFEWLDRNPTDEDRRGRFVGMVGDKIRIAEKNDFIIGIVSSTPAMIGNNYSESWKDEYLTDVWGQVIVQQETIPAEYEIINGEQTLIRAAQEKGSPILNPRYDPEEEYIPRHERKEWGAVGMFGQLVTIDNGSCVVDGNCMPGAGGIAVASEHGYRVIKRLDETHIIVLMTCGR